MTTIRYIYCHRRSYDAAREALDDMFASGDVSESELPEIEYRTVWGVGKRWCVMLRETA